MKSGFRPLHRATAPCLGLALVASSIVAAGAATAATADSGGNVVYVTQPPHAKADALAGNVSPSLTPAQCLAQTAGEFACHDPASIHSAYDIPTTINGQPAGTGKTIVIVDAFGSPTVSDDLATFDATFGLAAPPSFTVVYPGGQPTFHGTDTQVSWASETSLDVQWAHAVAPGADIVLDVAANNHGDVLNNAIKYAVDHHLGDVISMSFGAPEAAINGNSDQQNQAHQVFQEAAAAGITMLASSGDDGSDNELGTSNFGYRASDPLVTAVGGTNLWKGSGVTEPDETVWDDFTSCPTGCGGGPFGATGGAPSLLTDKQGSDVSYNASVYTGVLVQLGFFDPADNGLYFFGGTSAGSPQWAGIVAMVDQARGSDIGDLNPQLSDLATAGALSDVTDGNNETPTFAGGYSAGPGHDVPTGYGSPDGAKVIAALS